MKSESSKLWLGLGIGAVVGMAVGYLMTGENRRKVEDGICEVGNEIKDGAKTMFSKVKSKAEQAGSKVASKAEEWSDKVNDKAHQWAREAEYRANSANGAEKVQNNVENQQQYADNSKGK